MELGKNPMKQLSLYLGTFLFSGLALADPAWKVVAWTSPKAPSNSAKITAEQAWLDTDSLDKGHWYGYSGHKNVHTKNIQLFCDGVLYSLPAYSYEDLLFINFEEFDERSPRISIKESDVIFSFDGSSGEKCYRVHFHFRGGKFIQRILAYGEEGDIYILPAKA